MSGKTSVLQFPCMFPVKVMGRNTDEFTAFVRSVFAKHLPSLDDADIVRRPSSGDKYLSLTVTFRARSQEQLDTIYNELNNHELVLMTL
jgi:putative lipoic acid-binding regulatory protein